MQRFLKAVPLLCLFAGSFAIPAAAEPVDLQLVLAADISRSVDENEFRLQRGGYAAAFKDPRVLDAIASGPNGRVAVCYVEWSGVDSQAIIADWTVIHDAASGEAFGDAILARPRPFANRTSIGVAIDYAMLQFKRSGHESRRRVIDISGDGTNTDGRPPALARAVATATGVTVNGLVILSPEPSPWNPNHTHPPGGLPNYFYEHVVGGEEAFLVVVEDFSSFARAIVSKLVREIAWKRENRAELASEE